ncbi:MAG: ABC transporter permease [Pseudomonadota bacterium]|nr:ABC transporter permease [Pseudomonadota bacterium]
MINYFFIRILLIIPTVLGAGIIVFFVMRIIPGDICITRWVDFGLHFDQEVIVRCRQELGLNKPIHLQFYDFIIGFFKLDFGISMWTWKPIFVELKSRFGLSLQLAIMATTFATIIAIPLGIISALNHNTYIDYIIRIFSIAGVAMPSFWLGILMILGILVISQSYFGQPWIPPIEYVSFFKEPLANLSQLIWPTIAIGYRFSSVTMRMTRSALLEVMREDYIRTARSKGLNELIITNHHALKNAILPVITIIGNEFSFMMGGLVVIEQVFNLNGLGFLLVESVLNADYNMVQALVMVMVGIFVLVNFFIDTLYVWFDPRIRYN